MRNTVLATAVAATLALAAPQAFAQAKGSATKADVQAIEAQMKALAERLNKLETSNTQLQSENEQLKAVVERREAEVDYLKSQTKELREESAVAANEIGKVKGADWATKIKFKGDLRARSEHFQQERVVSAGVVDDAADRNRARIRARVGFDAKVTDNSKVVFQLATGGDDPRSSNQTLGGENTRKSIGVDLAYADWAFMQGANLTLGKVKQPFWRPGQSLFFDGDVNPEGVAVAFDRGMLFGSGYGWWLEERFNSNPTGQNADTIMLGAQLGAKFALFGGETKVAAHYYDLGGGQYSNPFYSGNAFGNSTIGETIGTTTTQVLQYDYNVADAERRDGPDAGQVSVHVLGRLRAEHGLRRGRRHRLWHRRDARQGEQRQDLGGGPVLPVHRQGRAVRADDRLGLRRRRDRCRRLGAQGRLCAGEERHAERDLASSTRGPSAAPATRRTTGSAVAASRSTSSTTTGCSST